MRKKMTLQEKQFADQAWELAKGKESPSEFHIKEAALEIVGYFQKRGDFKGRSVEGLSLRRLRGMVHLILDELESNE